MFNDFPGRINPKMDMSYNAEGTYYHPQYHHNWMFDPYNPNNPNGPFFKPYVDKDCYVPRKRHGVSKDMLFRLPFINGGPHNTKFSFLTPF